MPFVSARYSGAVALGAAERQEGQKGVQATDDRGVVWYLTEDSQIGDWLRYIEEGGTIEPALDAKPAPEKALPSKRKK